MKQWPTFRMSFRGFQKAFPEGGIFLNKPSSNPFLRLLDQVLDPIYESIGAWYNDSGVAVSLELAAIITVVQNRL